MTIALLASGLLAIAAGCGHSYLGERFVLRPIFTAEPRSRVLDRPINQRLVRYVWHLPSLAWIALGAFALWAAQGHALPWPVVAASAFILGTSGLANFAATRTLHIGGAVLTLSAALLVWGANTSLPSLSP